MALFRKNLPVCRKLKPDAIKMIQHRFIRVCKELNFFSLNSLQFLFLRTLDGLYTPIIWVKLINWHECFTLFPLQNISQISHQG